jgi:hypothetical protein
VVECQIAVAAQVKEIDARAPLIDAEGKLIAQKYPQEDDGAIEPLPTSATEVAQNVPESEFSGYLGLQRQK